MANRRWLKQEVADWIADDVITEETGKKILSRYKKSTIFAYQEAFFILAAASLAGGIFFLCASLWNGLSQDERFLLALGPLVLSFLLVLAVLLFDKKVPDRKKEIEKEGPLEEILEDGTESEGVQETAVTYHHRVPVFLREAICTFHGLCLIAAFWMVGDSFSLSSDMYGGLALIGLLLFFITLATGSAGPASCT